MIDMMKTTCLLLSENILDSFVETASEDRDNLEPSDACIVAGVSECTLRIIPINPVFTVNNFLILGSLFKQRRNECVRQI